MGFSWRIQNSGRRPGDCLDSNGVMGIGNRALRVLGLTNATHLDHPNPRKIEVFSEFDLYRLILPKTPRYYFGLQF